MPRPAAALRAATLLLAATPLGGCLAYKAVTAPVKLAATTAIVATNTAGTVVKSTGKLASSAARATGDVGSSAIDSAAALAQAGMVTFADAHTGTVVRVPWQQGLTLASAAQAARIDLAKAAVEIVRAGSIVYSTRRGRAAAAAVASGDVVRLAR